jgi:hypothetical protein
MVLDEESRLLSSRCQPAHPSFSNDGRWLNAIVGKVSSDARVTRLSIANLDPAKGQP